MGGYSQICVVPSTHPSVAGHFPGNPIVPGVVVIDCVLQALHRWLPEQKVVGIVHSKFLRPLKPDQPFTIVLTRMNTDGIRFECRLSDRAMTTGLLAVEERR